MKLKDRIKKSIFAFFKEEIMEAVKPDVEGLHIYPASHTILDCRLPHRIACYIDFDEEKEVEQFGMPANIILEKHIDKARKQMFEEFIKFVEVDSEELLRRDLYGRRKIMLTVFVGKKS